jgi:type I restriction enzyme S subunit
MESEKLGEVASVTAGTSPKGELINSQGLGLPFFQGTKEFGDLFPTAERFTEHPVRVAKKGEILIGVRAPVGEVNFATEDSAIGRGVMAVKAKNPEHVNFLFYFLKNLEGKWDSLGSTGSVFENLSASTLREISVPGGLHKKQIGDVLLNIDLKIHANRSLSKTLEGIAQTVFKSWFVDFDPVKAKMSGIKPAGMSDDVVALFPDSMEETDGGLFPMGWTRDYLGKHISVTKGKSYKSSELKDSETALVTLKSFARGGGYRFDGLKAFSGDYKAEQVVEPGELVVSFTDVTQAADVIGKPAIVLSNPQFSLLVASLDVGIVRPKSTKVGTYFLNQLFLTPMFNNHVRGYTNGTTVLHLGKGALEDFMFPLPSIRVLQAFEEFAKSIFGQIQSLYLQNLNLQDLRDSLLPRLISGELQIPEKMLA